MRARKMLLVTLAMVLLAPVALGILAQDAAAESDSVHLIRRYSSDEKNLEMGPGEEVSFKWLLYTESNDTRYLIIIKTNVSNDNFMADILSEADENLIVDKDSAIYIKLRVTCKVENKDQRTEINVSFEVIPLTQSEQPYFIYDNVKVKLVTPKEEPYIEFMGFMVHTPKSWTIMDYAIVRFIIEVLIYSAMAGLLILFVQPVVKKLVGKTKTDLDDILVDMLRLPLFALLVLWGILQSVKVLTLSSRSMAIFDSIWWATSIIILTVVGIKVFKTLTAYAAGVYKKKTNIPLDKILIPVLHKLGTVIIVFFGIMFTLQSFGIDITIFITGMGILGLVIAFAAQDTLSNFFGGVFLLMEPKFHEGDQIMLGDQYYLVRRIGMRTTILFDWRNNQEVIMPNSKLANEMIVNVSEPDRHYRQPITCSVGYGSDPEKIERIMREVADKHPLVMHDKDHPVYVELQNMGASSLDFFMRVWVEDLKDRWKVADDIKRQLLKRFEEEGIKVPFPQMDIRIRDYPKKAKNVSAGQGNRSPKVKSA